MTMPDISMCFSNACPKRRLCYRFRAIPGEHYQSYSDFFSENGGCTHFWPITEERVDSAVSAEERNERLFNSY